MKIQNQLDKEFAKLDTSNDESNLQKYIDLTKGYSEIENVMGVLSNLHARNSYVFLGRFSDLVDVDKGRCNGKISSIWEKEIFKAVHPDDLEMKMLQELLFFHYINRLPQSQRFNQCLVQKIRMLNRNREYIAVLHRLYYISSSDGKSVWLALCLYGAMTMEMTTPSFVIDTLTGNTTILDNSYGEKILTRQELTVLKLIEKGKQSREIAEILSISVHTVSRHRQNILAKLQVRNSAEACRMARSLSII